jgi:hypothetical protein
MQVSQRLSPGLRGHTQAVRPRAVCVTVRAAGAAQPASLPVKSADGADLGSEQLNLKVASSATAKGLVHRYVVYTLQNKRRVST